MPKFRKTRFRSRRKIYLRNLDKEVPSKTSTGTPQTESSELGVSNCSDNQTEMKEASNVAQIESPGPSYVVESAVKEKQSESQNFSGRRIVDLSHFLDEIKLLNNHKPFACNFTDMILIRERHNGLLSYLTFKCKLCNFEKSVSTDQENSGMMNVNAAAVFAAVSTGTGHSQMVQQQAILNIPQLSFRQYDKYHSVISESIFDSSLKAMEEAGREELELAKEVGDVDSDGNGLITVIADGAWSKRSYKVNYDGFSGVGCIVGAKTGKILFVACRNKFCPVCARHKDHSVIPEHKCFKNWNGTSTAMESDIVVEGFRRSVEMHKLKYVNLVGDGDSSVYKKLCIERPYGPRTLIRKIECVNHLLRNYCTKIRHLAEKRISSEGKVVSVALRKVVKQRIEKLRIGAKSAINYRRRQNCDTDEQIENLKRDIINCPKHVFGDHSACDAYFCKGGKTDEKNYVPDMVECGLMDALHSCGARLLQNAYSLILNMNNNAAETYNSVVCKFVGGKRQNFSVKNSYATRCQAAALSFNKKEIYYSSIHRAITGKSPGKFTKTYMERLKKHREYRKSRRQLFRCNKRKTLACADGDYGMVEEGITELPIDIEDKKNEFITSLNLTREEITKLELETRGQSSNPLWKAERSNRLTASNFGMICKKRPSTDPKNMIKNIISSAFTGSIATKWGQQYEAVAKNKFEKLYKQKIHDCGFYVHEKYGFLGATPDGIIDEDTLVEIKCPYSAAEMTVGYAVEMKKIKFLKVMENGELQLKKNDNYFYQVQGQMEVAQKKVATF